MASVQARQLHSWRRLFCVDIAAEVVTLSPMMSMQTSFWVLLGPPIKGPPPSGRRTRGIPKPVIAIRGRPIRAGVAVLGSQDAAL